MISSQNFLKIQIKLFRAVGFDIDIFSKSNLSSSPLLTFCTMGPMTLFILPMASFALYNLTDVEKLTEAMSPTLTGGLCVLKFTLFLYYRKDFIKLIASIRELLINESKINPKFSDIVSHENRSDQLLSLIYSISCYSAGVAAILVPFIKMGVTYSQSGSTMLMLPFPGIFPYDAQDMKFYILSYIWSIIAVYSVVTASICIDTLICSYTHNVCAHFRIAQLKMESFDPHADTLEHHFSELFRFHQVALKITDELTSAFRPLIFGQFFFSSLQICVICYQAASKLTEPEVLYFSIFALAFLLQIFIFAYCGERLKSESEVFALAIYNSLWYEVEPRLARSLLIPLARAQRPCTLDGIFFEANLVSLTSILGTAMSYITLLRSFEE